MKPGRLALLRIGRGGGEAVGGGRCCYLVNFVADAILAHVSLLKITLIALLLCGRVLAQTLLPVPDTRQSTDYSCGAAALQAVLAYYGAEVREDQLMRQLASDPIKGTSPEALLRVARHYGLQADLQQPMQIVELQHWLQQGFPIIVCVQAWREEAGPAWADDWDDGHYLVVIGVDADNVYFEDPSLLGSRGRIARPEFLQRWHDVEADGTRYVQAGIVLRGQPKPPPAVLPID